MSENQWETTVAACPLEINSQHQHERSTVDNFARQIEVLLPCLRRYARHLTHDAAAADDLVQETVTRGIEKIHLWRPGTDLRAWFLAILHNQYINGIRQASRNRVMLERTRAQPLPKGLPHQLAWLELRDVRRGLARLPEAQRAVVMSVGWGGERYDSIAARLGVPVGTIRSRLSRGRAKLRELIDSTDAPHPAQTNAAHRAFNLSPYRRATFFKGSAPIRWTASTP